WSSCLCWASASWHDVRADPADLDDAHVRGLVLLLDVREKLGHRFANRWCDHDHVIEALPFDSSDIVVAVRLECMVETYHRRFTPCGSGWTSSSRVGVSWSMGTAARAARP